MAYETCNACYGSGYMTGSESVPNPSQDGGSLYVQVEVRKTCFGCGGSGRISTPDPIVPTRREPTGRHSTRSQSQSQRSDNRHKSTQPEMSQPAVVDPDEKFANFLGLTSIGVSLYLLFNSSQPANPLAKLAIAFGVGLVCSLFFQKARRITRMLRHVVAILIFIAMLGGILFAWIGGYVQ